MDERLSWLHMCGSCLFNICVKACPFPIFTFSPAFVSTEQHDPPRCEFLPPHVLPGPHSCFELAFFVILRCCLRWTQSMNSSDSCPSAQTYTSWQTGWTLWVDSLGGFSRTVRLDWRTKVLWLRKDLSQFALHKHNYILCFVVYFCDICCNCIVCFCDTNRKKHIMRMMVLTWSLWSLPPTVSGTPVLVFVWKWFK